MVDEKKEGGLPKSVAELFESVGRFFESAAARIVQVKEAGSATLVALSKDVDLKAEQVRFHEWAARDKSFADWLVEFKGGRKIEVETIEIVPKVVTRERGA